MERIERTAESFKRTLLLQCATPLKSEDSVDLVSDDEASQSFTHPSSVQVVSQDSGKNTDSLPQLDKSLRIPLDRVETMIDGMSDLMVKRSRMQSDINDMFSVQRSVQDTYSRLQRSLRQFAEANEFTQQTNDTTPNAISQDHGFSETEWDRYDMVNIFSRQLLEMGADLEEAQHNLTTCIDGLENRGRDFALSLQSLQGQMGDLRTVNLRTLFNRLRMTGLEAASYANKDVRVLIKGQDESLDKAVIDRLLAPLIHVVRNAIAHGIETPTERTASR